MKQIKLKSLLKEDEMKAKAVWNKLDADSRENILLGIVKHPDEAEKMVMKTWDTLPNNITGNKDFQNDVTYMYAKKASTYSLTEKGSRGIKEDEMKAKAAWNKLDADSREDILMRFIKNPNEIEKAVMAKWDTLPDYVASNKEFQDALTTGKGLRETDIKMVDLVKEVMAYGEEEAIKMIWDDPGGKIESKLKGINGYKGIDLIDPMAKAYPPSGIHIYFTNKPAAIKGSRLLQHLVPGPEYKIRTEPSGYSIELKA